MDDYAKSALSAWTKAAGFGGKVRLDWFERKFATRCRLTNRQNGMTFPQFVTGVDGNHWIQPSWSLCVNNPEVMRDAASADTAWR